MTLTDKEKTKIKEHDDDILSATKIINELKLIKKRFKNNNIILTADDAKNLNKLRTKNLRVSFSEGNKLTPSGFNLYISAYELIRDFAKSLKREYIADLTEVNNA